MIHTGLLLLLLTAPVFVAQESPPSAHLEAPLPFDPCAVAERIARQGPCLRPDDCGAFQDWKRLFGLPRTEPLEPRFVHETARVDVPPSYLCPAGARTAARRPASR